jgi:hypothetical protein
LEHVEKTVLNFSIAKSDCEQPNISNELRFSEQTGHPSWSGDGQYNGIESHRR